MVCWFQKFTLEKSTMSLQTVIHSKLVLTPKLALTLYRFLCSYMERVYSAIGHHTHAKIQQNYISYSTPILREPGLSFTKPWIFKKTLLKKCNAFCADTNLIKPNNMIIHLRIKPSKFSCFIYCFSMNNYIFFSFKVANNWLLTVE